MAAPMNIPKATRFERAMGWAFWFFAMICFAVTVFTDHSLAMAGYASLILAVIYWATARILQAIGQPVKAEITLRGDQ